MVHSPSASEEKSTPPTGNPWMSAALLTLFVGFLGGLGLQSILESRPLAESFLSTEAWTGLIAGIGGELLKETTPAGGIRILGALAPLLPCLIIIYAIIGLPLLKLAVVKRDSFKQTAPDALRKSAKYWGIFAVWSLLWLVALIVQILPLAELLQGTAVFWLALSMAGTVFELLPVESAHEKPATAQKRNIPWPLIAGMAIYVLVFTAMNWGLWFNLRLPHGDSAMYEEHLWNVLHGKGFRSYLDQGLFWGEHIQFVHLLLIPLYWLWPSHLLLELCESVVLAVGAIPVFWLGRRASGSRTAGLWLAGAYLLYFPLQFLDIAVDLKTFRPIAFGVAPVLFALDQLERRRYLPASLLLLFSLTCKEDYAIVIFSIGLVLVAQRAWPWIVSKWTKSETETNDIDPFAWKYGVGCLPFGPVYLWSALKLIRSFRSGVEVHYAGYFSKFGESPAEIVWTMLTDPGLLAGELLTGTSFIYALAILIPLGCLPLRAPLRLLGCLPLFVLLCLNELATDPRHHFHAPLVPLLFWAAAGGLRARSLLKTNQNQSQEIPEATSERRGEWAWACGFATCIWFSLSPLGIAFWDSGSRWNAAELYIPDERAAAIDEIVELIPQSARVASTDYVHPRFTHHERSYDYSEYARRVAGYEDKVPDDTDYIVIDTGHPYSTVKSLADVRELQTEPERWEVIRGEGYFLVLRRR